MEDAFATVLFVVVGVAAVAAIWAAVGAGEVYKQIGRGAMSLNDGTDRPAREPTGAVASAERDEEVRQMLEARNARRVARGQEPVDVEAELRELTRPAADPGLEAEVRQLVEARNERRVRQGKEPLDVEAEVARQLRELG
ncbi:MAG: hypothetical protein HZB46_16715 [Solirubrobacterales bacterium]|nr:hypothetical protein [Solirubrobacterales bacterium]